MNSFKLFPNNAFKLKMIKKEYLQFRWQSRCTSISIKISVKVKGVIFPQPGPRQTVSSNIVKLYFGSTPAFFNDARYVIIKIIIIFFLVKHLRARRVIYYLRTTVDRGKLVHPRVSIIISINIVKRGAHNNPSRPPPRLLLTQ